MTRLTPSKSLIALHSTEMLYPISVVILNWNLPHDTIACVNSVLANNIPEVSITVVDNGSTDDSITIFNEHLRDKVTVIETGKNLGFAAGVNVGIRQALAAGAQSILLLNNDTVVAAQMIGDLVKVATDRPQAGAVGPLIYFYDRPQRIWRFADNEHRFLPVPLRVRSEALGRAGSGAFRVDYVTACGMLIRRGVFERIGLFDERYFMYFEDADFCRRIRWVGGFEIWCAPRAKMWHKVSLSARKNKPLNRYAQSWGRAHFYRNHPHGPVRLLTVLYLLTRLLYTTGTDLFGRDWELIKPSWQGTIDGYLRHPARIS